MPSRVLIWKLAKIYPQSLIAEIYKIFGIEDTEKFLTVFAGMTIKIPSTIDIENEDRNLAIYETLKKSQSGSESRRLGTVLCEQHKLKRKELREIFNATKRKLREAKKSVESDRLTSEHRRK